MKLDFQRLSENDKNEIGKNQKRGRESNKVPELRLPD